METITKTFRRLGQNEKIGIKDFQSWNNGENMENVALQVVNHLPSDYSGMSFWREETK